jgi:hypothetical protein
VRESGIVRLPVWENGQIAFVGRGLGLTVRIHFCPFSFVSSYQVLYCTVSETHLGGLVLERHRQSTVNGTAASLLKDGECATCGLLSSLKCARDAMLTPRRVWSEKNCHHRIRYSDSASSLTKI